MKADIRILIVEDSPTQAEKLRYILERNGYIVLTAGNGRQALDLMQMSRPSVVISDILMPEMDGFQFCKRVKEDEKLSGTPIILLTALSDPQDVLRGLECGADNFITKPYDENYLLTRIHHVLINKELRGDSKTQMGIEIFFKGQKYFITSEPRQILDLLLSTYETAVMKNHELRELQEELEKMNERLEKKVEERTAALVAEIQERRKAEEEVRQLNEELEQRVIRRTAQLEAANSELESFSYSVSHDLKAPLRVIKGFSELLLEQCENALDADSRMLLGKVNENANRMGLLIDDIFAFSRASRKESVPVTIDMAALAKSVVEELKSASAGRVVRFDVKDLPFAEGDLAAVKQVLFNLLSNAVKFTRDRDTAVIEIAGEERGDENVYSVSDNGAGFDEDYAGKLFGVFQRLHSAAEFEGTGIGLAIVKRFITKLGGRVWAEGKVDEGATFYFTLPKVRG